MSDLISSRLSTLAPHSRVWVYAAERPLTATEAELARTASQAFARQWVSHSRQLHSAAELLYDRFLILAVDQSQAGASGCSIDSSVHFVQQLGSELGIDFFNRMIFHFKDQHGEVRSLAREDFQKAYAEGQINDTTTVFDPLVNDLNTLSTTFEKPLQESWHARMV